MRAGRAEEVRKGGLHLSADHCEGGEGRGTESLAWTLSKGSREEAWPWIQHIPQSPNPCRHPHPP